MAPEGWVLIGAAILGSSVLTRALEGFFKKRQTSAEVVKTDAESKDIVVGAANTALNMMERNMAHMAENMKANSKKAAELEAKVDLLIDRVETLEATVIAYHRMYGPLDGHDIDWSWIP